MRDCFGDQSLDAGECACVGLDCQGVRGAAKLGHQCVGGGGVAIVVDDDFGTKLGEGGRGRGADALGAARYEGYSPCEGGCCAGHFDMLVGCDGWLVAFRIDRLGVTRQCWFVMIDVGTLRGDREQPTSLYMFSAFWVYL